MTCVLSIGDPSSKVESDIIHMIKWTRPSRSLHTASDQKLDGGKAWE